MAVNRGKQFEDVIKNAFKKVGGVSIDRLHDQTTGYRGSSNICDFIVFKQPFQYYIECKTVHGNTLPLSNITDNQWNGLLHKSHINGVIAGVMCWWVDKDVTLFIPINVLERYKEKGVKSIRYDALDTERWFYPDAILIQGTKKRVFFEYDMSEFFKEWERRE